MPSNGQIGLLLLLLLCWFSAKAPALNITRFQVPHTVPEGTTAALKCLYDLGSDRLYSLKWYWNETEFYRYEPKGKPMIQIFPIPEINLDLKRSNSASSLVVKELDVEATGIVKCEVSAEKTFLTVSKEQYMIIVPANCDSARFRANKLWTSMVGTISLLIGQLLLHGQSFLLG